MKTIAIISLRHDTYVDFIRKEAAEKGIKATSLRDAEEQLGYFCAIKADDLRGLELDGYKTISPLPENISEAEALIGMEQIAETRLKTNRGPK